MGGAGFEPALQQILKHTPPKAGHVYNDLLSQFERPLLIHALDHCGGNQLKAAQYLGINRNTLRKKLVDHAIDAAELR